MRCDVYDYSERELFFFFLLIAVFFFTFCTLNLILLDAVYMTTTLTSYHSLL